MMNLDRKLIPGILVMLCLVCIAAGAIFYLPSADRSSPNSGTNTAAGHQIGSTQPPAEDHIVYIETGHGLDDHGIWDSGCTWSDGSTTYQEAKLMLPIAKAMVSYLRQAGITVYTDADTDNDLNLADTLKYLDENPEIEAFVNIHCDSQGAGSGTMPLYRTEEQRALAEALNKGVHDTIEIADQGLTYREDLDTLTSDQIHCPSVLFETGSISSDNQILTEQADAYGKGLAKGLCDYLGVTFP